MAATFGRGAMTNHWKDIKNADVVLVMGANPAENHPCGFKWAIEARDQRGAQLLTIDPRFTRTSAVADKHLQIRPGSDVRVNRCEGVAWVGSATVSNEDAYLITKTMRSLGLIYIDHQARI